MAGMRAVMAWFGHAGVRTDVHPHRCLSRSGGFTLIELIMVIIVLGIMAGVAIPVIGTFIQSSKETATKDEMQRIARALAGSDTGSDRGYEGDVGRLPSTLPDLTAKPASVPAWDAFTHVGWNGPYIDSTAGDYLMDAWGQAYVYDTVARTLESNGSGSPITISF
jgi:general secretion pathway protein G